MATILELAELSNAAYSGGTIPGWSVLTTSANSNLASQYASDGYFAAVYQNTKTGEIVIANRGTRGFSSLTDLLSDLKIGLGGTPAVETDAAAFALKVAADNPGKPIIETGHSLGGAEAQAATVALASNNTTVSAVTFNSPGIASNLVTNAATSYNVLNLYDQGDALHLAGAVHLGSYGQNGLVMMPAGPDTSSLAWGAPTAVAAGTAGIAALLGAALYDVIGPAHSIANTIIPYLGLNGQGSLLGSTGWTAAGAASPITIAGSGSATGPTMSVDTNGSLVLTDASGNSVTISASTDGQNVNAIFSGGSSPIFQQLAAMGMVSIPASELGQAVTSLAGASTINETITRNQHIAGTFDVAFQNTGAPNSGDQFKVSVTNPGSVFNYIVPTNGQSVVETIDNGSTNSSGAVSVITGTTNTQLTGSTTAEGAGGIWTDSNGDQYQFTAASIGSNIGALTITKGLLGSGGNEIVINNFDLGQAEINANGYLGIKFGEQLAIVAGGSPVSPFTNGTPSSQTASVPNGNTKTFTLYTSAVSSTAQTITLSGGNATSYISTGANLLSFAGGSVNVTIPAGQDHATFTLVDTSTTSQPDTAQLTASYTDASGNEAANDAEGRMAA